MVYKAIYYNPNHLSLLTEPLYVVYCEVEGHPVLHQLCHQVSKLATTEIDRWEDFLEGIYRWRQLCHLYEGHDPVHAVVKRLDIDLLNKIESELAIKQVVNQLSHIYEFNLSGYNISTQTDLENSRGEEQEENPAFWISRAVEESLRNYQLKVYDADFPQLGLSVNGGLACLEHLEYIRQLRILPPFYIRPHVFRNLEPFLDKYQYPYPKWFHSLYAVK